MTPTANRALVAFVLLCAGGCGDSLITQAPGSPDDPAADSEFDEGPDNPGPGDVTAEDTSPAEPNHSPLPGNVPLAANPNCKSSRLFGKDGELRASAGRIIDAGFAGYHSGLDPIPNVAGPIKSVLDFGATANDTQDDTAAFQAAIGATTSGVLFVPAGRYIITKRLQFKKSNVVFRGAGQGQTVLFMPKSLGDIDGITFNGNGATQFSFGDAFLKANGSDSGARLASISANVARGNKVLKVSTTTGISVGQVVRVVQKDAGGTLFGALHGGQFPGNVGEDGGKEVFHFYAKVKAIGSKQITLERPLPFEVDTRWTPEVRAARPSMREFGIENMTLEFAGSVYPGHFKEHGFNGIQLSGLQDSWVRNVQILNADYGITLNGCFFSTVTDIVLDATFDRGPLVGHHGLNSSSGNDLLFTRFDVRKKFVHDLTVDGYAMGTVWSNGKGVDLNMDHHGRAPYGTLWSNLDMGQGKRPFGSGGSSNRLPHSAAFSTFWNLTARNNMKLPPADFGPLLNFISVKGITSATGGRADWSVENIAATDLCQPDLHAFAQAQRKAAP